MKRYLPVALLSSGFLLGLVLLLLALDVARADRGIDGDDARFLTQPRISGYWQDDGVLPFGAGRKLLGAEDDDVGATVGEFLVDPHHRSAPHRARLRQLGGAARRGDPEASVPREAVGQHAPVARLEDVQRERRAGEEDDSQGEDREPEGHVES